MNRRRLTGLTAAPCLAALLLAACNTGTTVLPVNDPPIAAWLLDAEAFEDAGVVEVCAELDRHAPAPITLSLLTEAGSATPETDYRPAASPLEFPQDSLRACATVELLDDALHEGDEEFRIRLGSAEGVIVKRAEALVRILENDPLPALSVHDAAAAENAGVLRFPLRLRGGRTHPVVVSYATEDDSAQADTHYAPVSGRLAFGPEDEDAFVEVQLLDDSADNPDRQLRLVLSQVEGARLDRGTAYGRILDDEPAPVAVSRLDDGVRLSLGDHILELSGSPVRLRWETPSTVVTSADPRLPDPVRNPDHALYDNRENGIDVAYPGLPDVSYRPFAYRTAAGWQTATAVLDAVADGATAVTLDLATSDGAGARLSASFAPDGALEIEFRPGAAVVQAVSMALAAPPAAGFYGGGQRFSGFNLRGLSVPLWISHGLFSDRSLSTNEIAASFFWTPAGWGAASRSDARGEIVFAQPAERADSVLLMQEDDALPVTLYRGLPREILRAHTARAGRPAWTPPDWMWRPAVWQDEDTTQDSVRALVRGMAERDIPLGAVWLDNPWDAGRASFDFAPSRFADPDALIAELHGQDIRMVVWASPFVGGALLESAQANGHIVSGARADNNDATYWPPRRLDPHLDFTHPDAVRWWQERLRRLIARGVDGLKLDRGEEDLSDDSRWANGQPNRLNHNTYVERYHRAAFEAFEAERPDGDFALYARGGWNGSARWSGHWAADNLALSGTLGLTQAVRSLLSLSVSGFPFSGSDLGGYVGLRQDMGEDAAGNPVLPPTPATYARWVQLGALSPVMQTAVPPWWVDEEAVRIYRRYAVLHDRLVPYIARWARAAIEEGLPIVRPLVFEYPQDTLAALHEDQYLFGPDLLVAPIHGEALEAGMSARPVYLPAGRWVNFWTGESWQGPLVLTVPAPLDQVPLFVREGAELPPGVAAAELP